MTLAGWNTLSCGGVSTSPNEYISAVKSFTCIDACATESTYLSID